MFCIVHHCTQYGVWSSNSLHNATYLVEVLLNMSLGEGLVDTGVPILVHVVLSTPTYLVTLYIIVHSMESGVVILSIMLHT
jgi:hypothetical protein